MRVFRFQLPTDLSFVSHENKLIEYKSVFTKIKKTRPGKVSASAEASIPRFGCIRRRRRRRTDAAEDGVVSAVVAERKYSGNDAVPSSALAAGRR